MSEQAPRKRGRPPKNPDVTPVSETNNYAHTEVQSNSKTEVTHEFCTMNSSLAYSYSYFGFNIFDYYSHDQLAALVRDPMANNELLREISLILYGTCGAYTHAVDFQVAMPTLDKVVVPHGTNKQKRKKNKELMESTMRTIKDREIIRDALFRGMVEGIYYGYLETTSRPVSNKKFMTDHDVEAIAEINELGINASVISLPASHTKIVGIKNSSYIIAFDLDYFDCADGESAEQKLRKYPKEIRDAYEKRHSGKESMGNWVVLNNNNTIVHKIRSKREECYGRPLVLAAINDILYGDYFTQTKRNVLDEINNRVVFQTFPEGERKGVSALTKQQQESQHNAVKSAVMNKNNRGGTSFFSVAAGTKIDALDTQNTDIFDEKYESNLNDKIALGLGFGGSLINGVATGSYSAQISNLELITAQLFQWIDQIAEELNKCINANIIKDNRNWVECKYLPITHVNKDKMVGFAKDLYLQGKGSLSLWASACGISSDVFFALLDLELEEDIENKYPVHITSYVASGNNSNNKGGRPETDDPSDATVASRANNGNSIPSPSD